MSNVELKISRLDWVYIIIIGAFFGFFISFFLFLINANLKEFSTILFGTTSAVSISLSAFVFISISNDLILPRINEKFWYLISFIFSFLSGFLGFVVSYALFSFTDFPIISFLKPIWIYISIVIGFFTFLIGLILHQFISMKYKNESIKSEVLDSKIKALENELNPHFLFNALNSISELIYLDQKKAEKATLDLSKFLRNAITRDSLIELESEIKMVETYLKIENIRFDDNIKLQTNISKDFKKIEIPKFSIQLLVENAIKHGFNSKELNIDITIKDDNIIVSNDGRLSENVSFGTGLSNLKNRLELLNIGNLTYKKENDKMYFIIELKGKN
ncbi:sensor histidine kinase [Poseidonibacter ostreae]|jgi:two-component system, LytTR family, sensor kinase|uniref:Histidine kinase n=1 Tax=Poseidonibacter ostreae TaxID=2654171 RepID=A0A6L4WQG7_9BACT|nr:histidine kinase [Poseidonibacter ostreae]KAB7884947.1 histidine kinase [Poseidonibacter ostreae]KAB7886756.1 histidine kinase [Poseidonibacter ostreae]KAB7892970.1 histidine kinase [Poseidonibacter ostreae]